MKLFVLLLFGGTLTMQTKKVSGPLTVSGPYTVSGPLNKNSGSVNSKGQSGSLSQQTKASTTSLAPKTGTNNLNTKTATVVSSGIATAAIPLPREQVSPTFGCKKIGDVREAFLTSEEIKMTEAGVELIGLPTTSPSGIPIGHTSGTLSYKSEKPNESIIMYFCPLLKGVQAVIGRSSCSRDQLIKTSPAIQTFNSNSQRLGIVEKFVKKELEYANLQAKAGADSGLPKFLGCRYVELPRFDNPPDDVYDLNGVNKIPPMSPPGSDPGQNAVQGGLPDMLADLNREPSPNDPKMSMYPPGGKAVQLLWFYEPVLQFLLPDKKDEDDDPRRHLNSCFPDRDRWGSLKVRNRMGPFVQLTETLLALHQQNMVFYGVSEENLIYTLNNRRMTFGNFQTMLKDGSDFPDHRDYENSAGYYYKNFWNNWEQCEWEKNKRERAAKHKHHSHHKHHEEFKSEFPTYEGQDDGIDPKFYGHIKLVTTFEEFLKIQAVKAERVLDGVPEDAPRNLVQFFDSRRYGNDDEEETPLQVKEKNAITESKKSAPENTAKKTAAKPAPNCKVKKSDDVYAMGKLLAELEINMFYQLSIWASRHTPNRDPCNSLNPDCDTFEKEFEPLLEYLGKVKIMEMPRNDEMLLTVVRYVHAFRNMFLFGLYRSIFERKKQGKKLLPEDEKLFNVINEEAKASPKILNLLADLLGFTTVPPVKKDARTGKVTSNPQGKHFWEVKEPVITTVEKLLERARDIIPLPSNTVFRECFEIKGKLSRDLLQGGSAGEGLESDTVIDGPKSDAEMGVEYINFGMSATKGPLGGRGVFTKPLKAAGSPAQSKPVFLDASALLKILAGKKPVETQRDAKLPEEAPENIHIV